MEFKRLGLTSAAPSDFTLEVLKQRHAGTLDRVYHLINLRGIDLSA
ncbi:hypothetical protein [Porphyromonas sp. HMSC065F10]|nr:hypothetical protein [Porphyromonas sp. HMSC065F10]